MFVCPIVCPVFVCQFEPKLIKASPWPAAPGPVLVMLSRRLILYAEYVMQFREGKKVKCEVVVGYISKEKESKPVKGV